MIRILHVKNSDDETLQRLARDLSMRGPERFKAARKLLAADAYEAVAAYCGDDLDAAYRLTQNGVSSPSWSRLPPPHLIPLEPRIHVCNGQEYGRRSSMIGDIFERAGERFVVDTYGFTKLEG